LGSRRYTWTRIRWISGEGSTGAITSRARWDWGTSYCSRERYRRNASQIVGAPYRKTPDDLFRLHAQQELDLSELVRLKTAGRIEPIAEAEELERRHRFEDVELRDHDLEDRQDPFQRVLRAVRFVRFEELHDAIELVQQFLEPELVDLVDDDEQRLVVFWSRGARLLQRQEIVELEIALVCRGRLRVFRHGARPEGSISAPADPPLVELNRRVV
jgi:hypothetical protein